MLLALIPHAFCFVGAAHMAQSTPAVTPVAVALAQFRAAHGTNWQMLLDQDTGFAEMIHGGSVALGGLARTEDEARLLAGIALDQTAELHGVRAASLSVERVVFLPLGQIGSGDKWTVRYAQSLNGLSIEGGAVNVLLDTEGRLLSVHSTAVAGELAIDTAPRLTEDSALAVAGDAFLREHGVLHVDADRPELVARQLLVAGRRTARAAWTIELSKDPTGQSPIVERYWIDAQDGEILAVENQIHHFDVTGTVQTKATPGLAPDSPSNPATNHVLRYARVQSSAGETTTDENGVFNYPGVNTPLSVTLTYYGTYNSVVNSAGAALSLVQVVQPNTPTTLTLNPSPSQNLTAQANAMVGVNVLRDWIRGLNPTDTTSDMRFVSNVNQAQTCNAFYNGSSVNYFLSGDGCPNTCYSTVVAHEMGHWLNVLYGTGNNGDGMGEGNADVWSMYCHDTPVIAQDFFGIGLPIRTGLNTSLFCGDATPGCHGGAHANGEPWMGAAWKIRARLNVTHGNTLGDMIANSIFLGWMNTYNQTTLRAIIETQWLTLDDDDANLNNGTPHFTDIDAGFRDQGFPGVTLLPLVMTGVTSLPDTENEVGPYTVDATVTANFSPPLTATILRYRVNGSAFVDVPMTNQGAGLFRGTIPGAPYPSLVQYYVTAADSGARTVTSPPSAPEQIHSFDVGTKSPISTFFFDVSSSGWTTGTVGDTSNAEVDWARGVPLGRSGTVASTEWRDPSTAFGGASCFANDLGTGGSDGAYSANVHSYLRSAVQDCSGKQNVRLRFQSWLSVEGSALDQARLLVNGTQFYVNPATARVDTTWGTMEFDISSVAANNPSVTIEFRLRSNATNQFGGWAIDNVELFSLSPVVPPCPAPQTYCIAAPSSVSGGAQMGYSGTGNLILNNLNLFVYACPPSTTGLFFYGTTAVQTPFGNGFRCVGGTTFRLGTQVTDAFGDATRPLNLNTLPSGPASAGQILKCQFWYRNPAAGGAGFNLSNGLSVTVCN